MLAAHLHSSPFSSLSQKQQNFKNNSTINKSHFLDKHTKEEYWSIQKDILVSISQTFFLIFCEEQDSKEQTHSSKPGKGTGMV